MPTGHHLAALSPVPIFDGLQSWLDERRVQPSSANASTRRPENSPRWPRQNAESNFSAWPTNQAVRWSNERQTMAPKLLE